MLLQDIKNVTASGRNQLVVRVITTRNRANAMQNKPNSQRDCCMVLDQKIINTHIWPISHFQNQFCLRQKENYRQSIPLKGKFNHLISNFFIHLFYQLCFYRMMRRFIITFSKAAYDHKKNDLEKSQKIQGKMVNKSLSNATI